MDTTMNSTAPTLPDEPVRLAALMDLEILDTDPEPNFDRIVRLAASIFDAPIALVSLVDKERQWFKAKLGLEVSQTPREVSFCGHAIASDSILEVSDTLSDERFVQNPLVTDFPHIRYYAGRPIHAPGGERIGTLCVIDRCVRVMSELERSQLNDLAGIVEDELVFRAETLKSREASEIKSQFIAELSHEIRTPTNILLGSLELLQEPEGGTPQDPKALEMASNAGDHIARLLNDLVDVSHIESGQFELDQSQFQLIDLLTQLNLFAEVEIKKKGLTFQSEIQEELPEKLIGDPARIRQILINLVTNAVRYTEFGQIVLNVSAELVNDSESLDLAVSVKDTGIGISEVDSERIFHPFYRSKQARAIVAEGSGLGLALVYRLARLMNGTITVESDGKSGSTFKFLVRLPLASRMPDEEPTVISSRRVLPEEFREATILVVEDSAAIRALVEAFLADFGKVEFCEDAESALKFTSDNRADVILMDISLPDMDGVQCAKRIRQLPLFSGSKIIAFTAHAVKGDRENFLESGFDEYLAKPFTKDSLITKIEEVLTA